MSKDIKSFIARIQKSDEETKKRWLIVFSVISSIIVIGLWAVYLNFTTVSVIAANPLKNQRPGFLRIFSTGVSVVGDKTTTGLANSYVYFSDKAKSENKFLINKEDHNFIYQEIKPLPNRPLP
jgi:hypothetical protein